MKPFLTAALAALLLTVSPAFPQTITDSTQLNHHERDH
jgi:hypothetical protein